MKPNFFSQINEPFWDTSIKKIFFVTIKIFFCNYKQFSHFFNFFLSGYSIKSWVLPEFKKVLILYSNAKKEAFSGY